MMAKVISRIHKYELPDGVIFALKYVDLEACFASRSKQDLYLDVVFLDKQSADKKIRDRLEAQGIFQLLKFRYDPSNSLLTAWEWENGPWKGVKNPTIIEAWIYGLPRKLCSDVGLDREKLQKILCDEIKKLLPKGTKWGQRKFTLRLLAKERAVECTSTAWGKPDGEPEETTRIVSLDKHGKS